MSEEDFIRVDQILCYSIRTKDLELFTACIDTGVEIKYHHLFKAARLWASERTDVLIKMINRMDIEFLSNLLNDYKQKNNEQTCFSFSFEKRILYDCC